MRKLALLLSIILIPFYIIMLYVFFHPNVSDEYRKYYIDRSTNLSIKQQLKKAKSD